ncbi:uncharacterized protein CXorf38 [Paramormyrops kingsleyae]|uniref:uncharacterized protein CXorf38 n=1 Tax=Paramormyrops kingsleyae TaxID=1676925 RepID=UPI000CD604EE|nr:uncharacterized protein CXorf38 homolog [Paramormyrops kingsleyae]
MVYEELSARLNESGYKNWLKAGYCLLKVKDGLCDFVNNEMKCFHAVIIDSNHVLRSGRQCQNQCRPKGNQFTSVCSVCREWKAEILRHHTNTAGVVNWSNCKPWLWSFQHWELAKAYMPRGQVNSTSPEQCDAAALLNLINFCDHFSFIDQQSVREVIRQRNELMHSCEMRVSPKWMAQLQRNLDQLLQQLRRVPKVAAISQEIREILSADWSVSFTESDAVDGAQWEGVEPELISQLETDLLREKLDHLLVRSESEPPPDPKELEELGKLKEFIRLHPDLEKCFQTHLCKDQSQQFEGDSMK